MIGAEIPWRAIALFEATLGAERGAHEGRSMMRRTVASTCVALVVPMVLAVGGAAYAGGPSPHDRDAETHDQALRRAQAFHDMYASDEDQTQYETQKAAHRIAVMAAGGPHARVAAAHRAPRPLPIIYRDTPRLRQVEKTRQDMAEMQLHNAAPSP